MEDPLDTHHYEGLHDLFKYSKDLLNAQLFIFLLIVVQKISLFTIFHYYFQLLIHLIEMRVVYLDQIWVHELFHHLYLLQRLIPLKWVDVNTLQGKRFILAVLYQINTAKTALTDCLD